jgi:outer membrane immunogenic protein
MKRLIAALAASFFAGSAYAADFLVQPAFDGYNWSGFYIGAGGGVGAGVHELNIPAGPVNFNGIGAEGIFGEVTIGYDFLVTPRFLLGAYADFRFGGIDTTLSAPGFSASLDAEYGFDILARAGYLFTPRTLGYLLGGYTWQHFDLSVPGFGNYDWDSSGYVLGFGMETAIAEKITLKTEYRYSDYSSEDLFAAGFVTTEPSYHTFHVGLNYRFNGGSTAVGFATPAYHWTGFYVGLAGGAGAIVHDVTIPATATFNGIGGEGVLGELSVGYDYEFANGFVAGVMADARLSNLETTLTAPGFGASVEADYGFDILARLGMKVNDATLAYLLGGYSWQNFDVTVPGLASDLDWDSSGFSVGGGLETAMSDRLSVNVEYRYSQYNDESFFGVVSLEPSMHTVRAGVKWKLF